MGSSRTSIGLGVKSVAVAVMTIITVTVGGPAGDSLLDATAVVGEMTGGDGGNETGAEHEPSDNVTDGGDDGSDDGHNVTDDDHDVADDDGNVTDDDGNMTGGDHNVTDGDHNVTDGGHGGPGDDTNVTDGDTNETDGDGNVTDSDDDANETERDSQEIDSCTTITEPGRYEIVTDVEDSDAERCIVIEAEDVTLDGDGHVVDGVEEAGTAGIVVDSVQLSNVQVENMTVREWGDGVLLTEGESTVQNVTAVDNRNGFETQTMDTTLSDVTARNNTVAGIYGADAATDFTIVDSRVANNEVDGIVLQRTGSVRLRGTVVEANSDDGVDAFEIEPSALDNNVVRDNGDVGILAISDDLSIDENTITGNGNEGLVVRDSDDPSLRENVVRGNGLDGITLLKVTDASLQNNTACDNDGREFDYEDTTFEESTDNGVEC